MKGEMAGRLVPVHMAFALWQDMSGERASVWWGNEASPTTPRCSACGQALQSGERYYALPAEFTFLQGRGEGSRYCLHGWPCIPALEVRFRDAGGRPCSTYSNRSRGHYLDGRSLVDALRFVEACRAAGAAPVSDEGAVATSYDLFVDGHLVERGDLANTKIPAVSILLMQSDAPWEHLEIAVRRTIRGLDLWDIANLALREWARESRSPRTGAPHPCACVVTFADGRDFDLRVELCGRRAGSIDIGGEIRARCAGIPWSSPWGEDGAASAGEPASGGALAFPTPAFLERYDIPQLTPGLPGLDTLTG